MTDLLAPRPMTPAQIADLVERTRQGMQRVARLTRHPASDPVAYLLRRNGWHTTSRVRCAARYSALTGCSLGAAAWLFRVNGGSVHAAWCRVYPGVPTSTALRGAR